MDRILRCMGNWGNILLGFLGLGLERMFVWNTIMKLRHILSSNIPIKYVALISNLRMSTTKLKIDPGRYSNPHPKPADNSLSHYERYKALRFKFIAYWDMKDHYTSVYDSYSRDIFKTTNTDILISFGQFVAECYRNQKSLSTEILIVSVLYIYVLLVLWDLEIVSAWQCSCFMFQ